MLKALLEDVRVRVLLFLFTGFSSWWLFLSFIWPNDQQNHYVFAALYGSAALIGGIWGLTITKKWGGMRSVMGLATLYLSVGLFAQEFGQLVFSYYNVFLHVEIPYPSLADVGYFGNIPLYIVGALLLARASGIQFSLEKIHGKIVSVFIPIVMLVFAYVFFLRDYVADWSDPLRVFLDFGYPFGQAIYVSVAFVTYVLLRNLLGGVMKNRIMLFLVAFVLQFLSDYNFLFQTSRGTWKNGGYGDYLYFLAYCVMALGLIFLDKAHDELTNRVRK